MFLLSMSLRGERSRRDLPRLTDSWVTVLLEPLEPFDFWVRDEMTEISEAEGRRETTVLLCFLERVVRPYEV